MGGLSRSGSTLLCALLNQNPKIYASENSPICDLTYKLNLLFDSNDQYQGCPFEDRRINVVRSLIDNYYYDVKKPFIVDKFRSWGTEYNISMIKALYTENVKIICPVRNVLEVLASWINLFEQNKNYVSFIDKQINENLGLDLTTEERNKHRCDLLMHMDGGIFHQIETVRNCLQNKYKGMFHLMDYENLVTKTNKELEKLYEFLGLKSYLHDLENIDFESQSRDAAYFGTPNLHKVRKKICKISPDPMEVLPESSIKKYKGLEFWK